jgi:hypothetical protein
MLPLLRPALLALPATAILTFVFIVSPAASGDGAQDRAVGGAQFIYPCAAGEETDSLSAHVPTGTAVTPGVAQSGAGGTFNASIPQSTADACGTSLTHLVAKVDCLRVDAGSPPGTADLTASVTEASGAYAGVGPEISISVSDSGTSTVPDAEVFAHTSGPCVFTTTFDTKFLVNHGQFSVSSGG